jgi:hypothetical protein
VHSLMKILLTCLLIMLSCFYKKAEGQVLSAGTGSFIYSGYSPLRNKPVRVYYHIPVGATSRMPVLLAFHGDDRDAQGALADWVRASDQYNFMVFAPEFTDASFGGGDGYNLGNMFVDGDNPTTATRVPDSLWTFAIIEPLFQDIKSRTSSSLSEYVAFGHSAGAQFLHRFVEYVPVNSCRKFISANSGWYTVPDASVDFPYGTRLSVWNSTRAQQAFANKLLIFLGQNDVNPNSAGLRHTPEADAQGLFRLARGRYFFSQSQAIARAGSYPYNWSIAEVPGVGHDHTLMATNAIPHVLAEFTALVPPAPKTVPNIVLTASGLMLTGLDARERFDLLVCSPLGQRLFSTSGVFVRDTSFVFEKGAHSMILVSVKGAKHSIHSRRFFVY